MMTRDPVRETKRAAGRLNSVTESGCGRESPTQTLYICLFEGSKLATRQIVRKRKTLKTTRVVTPTVDKTAMICSNRRILILHHLDIIFPWGIYSSAPAFGARHVTTDSIFWIRVYVRTTKTGVKKQGQTGRKRHFSVGAHREFSEAPHLSSIYLTRKLTFSKNQIASISANNPMTQVHKNFFSSK